MSIKKIIVTGKTIDPIINGLFRGEERTPLVQSTLVVERTFDLSESTRGGQEELTVDLEENIAEFTFEDGTTWMCDSSNLHELFDEPIANRDIIGAFRIPSGIIDSSTERGIAGFIAAKLLRIFLKAPIQSGVTAIAEKMESAHLGTREGLNFLNKGFEFTPFNKTGSPKPYLLFIHGTNSDTKGAYEGLLKNAAWNYIFNTYGENVLAFEHRTLTESPLQNALALAKQLPDNAEVHIVSHSRGGLIGEILCRYSTDSVKQITGFSEENKALLHKENRIKDIECINGLDAIYRVKKLTIKKFIRVACPAAGTKLASRRMDQIFNVLYNLLGREANDVAVILKELIAETLNTKENINVLPGIEAMSPASPFIKILNDRADEMAIDGSSLAVISGNGISSVSFRGLFIILAKLFYEQRNDLVVNTDSMYLGVQRKPVIQYFFDEGKIVDHITYFKNNNTCKALEAALRTEDGKSIPGFKTESQYEVPATDRGLLPKFEHGELFPVATMPDGDRPIVVLLPGIMGSNLERKPDKLWLAYARAIIGKLTELEYTPDSNIRARSVISSSYKRLAERLSRSYDVIIYPFDWRKPLNDCTKEFDKEIRRLLAFKKPMKIIAHSMGGMLVRDFVINPTYNDTWQQLNKSEGFKLLFLGTPLGGSYRIPAVLFGNDPIINSLSMLDRVNTKKQLVEMFVKFPGIMCLLPLTTGKNERGESQDFADINTWIKMRDAFGDGSWPIPDSALAGFKAYRDHINSKKDSIDFTNMMYIAGKDKYTPCAYYNDSIPPRTELVFLYTSEGDQSVTWDTAIPPKMSEAGNVYYVDVTHGALANAPDIFSAIEDLLEKGTTTLITKTRPSVRGEEKLFRMPEQFDFDFSERGIEKAVLGITKKNKQQPGRIALSVSVSHGDLAYASFPVLAGHFAHDGILYAEKTIDKLMDGTLSVRKTLGIYPGNIGTSAILPTNRAESDFAGSLIIGLGEAGELTAFSLIQSVEQALAKYILDMNSQPDNGTDLGISSLIIGCGYGGLSVENAVRAIIEGVNNANSKVSEACGPNIRLIQHLEFIELYEDRALSCMYALKKIETGQNNIYNITISNKSFKKLFGYKRRLPVDFPDEWWRRITVKARKSRADLKEPDIMVFNASTGNAREEQTELSIGKNSIDLFIQQISDRNEWSVSSAKTLFELMIPNSLKDELKKKGNISWILEPDTAAYPWELLQPAITGLTPLGVNAGMIRQLSTLNFRGTIQRVANDKALIIADPLLNGFAHQLPGAKKEGEIVDKLLQTNQYVKEKLINKNSAEILQSLFCDDYKIIHLAGHGFFNGGEPGKSGMVIGKDMFLTTAHINQMNTVPELVFINCCHLGKIEPGKEKLYHDKYKLAANMGTQLIEMGVKAVVVAGWAVDDAAAYDFATEFYTKILAGYNFGDSVKSARSIVYAVHHQNNNTWGAYQCYGDPFYKLINRSTKIEKEEQYIMPAEVDIDLENLLNNLDTKNYTFDTALNKLTNIREKKDKSQIKGVNDEFEAQIYYELGEYARSVESFEGLRMGEKAKFSVASLEKYCNVRCKKYLEEFRTTRKAGTLINDIEVVIKELDMLLYINPTAERYSLLGSAYKRKAVLYGTNKKKKVAAYKKAAEYYAEAWKINQGDQYAYKNCLVLSALLNMMAAANKFPAVTYIQESDTDAINRLEQRRLVLSQLYRNMDYWELIEDAAIDYTILILDKGKGAIDENWTKLGNKFERIWKKAGSRGKKKAEIESFEVLIDLLAMSTDPQSKALKKQLISVKEYLYKIISD